MVSQDVLAHYGVLGMKWGVRKDPERAHARASTKLRKLDKKLYKKSLKMQKAHAKATEKAAKATTERKLRKAEKAKLKYNRKVLKSEKARKKALRWYSKMEATFADVELSNVGQEDLDLGKAYAQMLFEEERKGHVY